MGLAGNDAVAPFPAYSLCGLIDIRALVPFAFFSA